MECVPHNNWASCSYGRNFYVGHVVIVLRMLEQCVIVLSRPAKRQDSLEVLVKVRKTLKKASEVQFFQIRNCVCPLPMHNVY
jgi:hypothetical protein